MILMTRTYSELVTLPTFEDRYEYLRLQGVVGERTFGWERFANQKFYTSYEWKRARRDVISRDLGCDLAVEGYDLHSDIIVHHMNPMEAAQLSQGDPDILNIEYLVSCSLKTHNAIHYGDEEQLPRLFAERRAGDTLPWG
jgi:hypothetical protein